MCGVCIVDSADIYRSHVKLFLSLSFSPSGSFACFLFAAFTVISHLFLILLGFYYIISDQMKSQLAAIILSVHIYCEFCVFFILCYIEARIVSQNVYR